MWTSNWRHPTSHGASWQQAGFAAAVLAGVGLVGCTAVETPPAASPSSAPSIEPLPESGVLEPGTYLATGFTVPFEITVPHGWMVFDGAALGKESEDEENGEGVFVYFWSPRYVPSDVCAWNGGLVEVDPTAEAFVDAVRAQAWTESTLPTEVSVGDYSGFEFNHGLESDADFTDCDGNKICVHSEMANECSRWYSGTTEHETYRVVDLDGERAVIAMGEFRAVDPALTKETRAIFDSIVFTGIK